MRIGKRKKGCTSIPGFTLIEIMLIVAALSILTGVTIIAINPGKQLANVRDGQREIDISTIWSAVHQYALDNHGTLPTAIPTATLAECLAGPIDGPLGICRTDTACPVVLTELLEQSRYLTVIPADPASSTSDYSGYTIVRDSEHNNRVTVCAPATEERGVLYLPH